MTDLQASLNLDEEEAEAQRVASMEEAMKADGVPTHEVVQQSYFGFDERHKVYLPDGKSYVEHRPLTEGDRRSYMNEIQKEVKLQRATGDAIMKMQTGEERYQLLMKAIVGWNLIDKNGNPVPFNSGSPGSQLGQFLNKANPKIVDIIHKDVVKHNPWLMADLTVEEIDKQIEELQELRETKAQEEAGKES